MSTTTTLMIMALIMCMSTIWIEKASGLMNLGDAKALEDVFVAAGWPIPQGVTRDDYCTMLPPVACGLNDTRVFVLNFRDYRLTGSIATEIGLLTEIFSLDFSGNDFTGPIPSHFGNLKNLTILNLSGNNLTGTIPEQIMSLSSLTQLRLEENKLTGSIPTKLDSLKQLQQLILYSNSLDGGLPSEIGYLSSLKNLNFNYNKITGQLPTEIGKLTSLQYFYARSNEITGTIPTEVGNMKSMTQIYLNYNKLNGTIPTQLAITGIEQVVLANNTLTGTIPLEFKGLLSSLQLLLLLGTNNFCPVVNFYAWAKTTDYIPNISNECDDCASSPCLNGGKCTDIGATFTCQCPFGKNGVYCENEASKCQESKWFTIGWCNSVTNVSPSYLVVVLASLVFLYSIC